MNEPRDNPRRQLVALIVVLTALILCFAWPLVRLARFAISSELYSFVILIPLISLYLVWIKRDAPTPHSHPASGISLFFLVAGLVVLAAQWTTARADISLEMEDSLCLSTLSFVFLFWGICAWFLGRKTLCSIAFPLGFLILMVPLPVLFRTWIESQLQFYSAVSALGLFRLAGTPVFYHDLTFQLPDISLKIAPECSGIHSSVALFITSLLAGHFFLRSNWRRGALALAVLPLAILRNGFRVFTIGELCVHFGQEMIDSPIHHKGGPIFFILSLVPFIFLLFLLIRSERTKAVLKHILHEM